MRDEAILTPGTVNQYLVDNMYCHSWSIVSSQDYIMKRLPMHTSYKRTPTGYNHVTTPIPYWMSPTMTISDLDDSQRILDCREPVAITVAAKSNPGQRMQAWRVHSLSRNTVIDLDISRNAPYQLRAAQARIFEEYDYRGPVKGSEAKGLSRFFMTIGKDDYVRRGWFFKETLMHAWRRSKLIYCYVFKCPIPGVDFADFMLAVRAFKSNGKFRQTVKALIDNPDNAVDEINTLKAMLTLAKGMGK